MLGREVEAEVEAEAEAEALPPSFPPPATSRVPHTRQVIPRREPGRGRCTDNGMVAVRGGLLPHSAYEVQMIRRTEPRDRDLRTRPGRPSDHEV